MEDRVQKVRLKISLVLQDCGFGFFGVVSHNMCPVQYGTGRECSVVIDAMAVRIILPSKHSALEVSKHCALLTVLTL